MTEYAIVGNSWLSIGMDHGGFSYSFRFAASISESVS